MSIITSIGRLHIKGIHDTKSLTAKSDVLRLDQKHQSKVYVPMVSPNAIPLTLNVKVGDEIKKGSIIGVRTDFNIPVFSPVSGKITATEMIFHATAGRPVNHLVIENDFKDEEEHVLTSIGKDATSEEIVEQMRQAGIVGLGGAGFPTYLKYKNVKDIHTILLNGVECEPFLTTDYKEMQFAREDLFIGAELLIKAAGAQKAIITFKSDKVDVLAKLNEIKADYPNVIIKTVPDVYPMGWERLLVKQIFKKTYKSYPSEIGVVVNNVQTAIAVKKAVIDGQVMLEKSITVSGTAIKEKANVIVPLYTKAADIVDFLGGYTHENVNLLMGGPMTSKAQMNDQCVVLPNCNSITVMKKVEYKTEACLRCGECTLHCPAGLQPVEIKNAVDSKNNERILALKPIDCIGCGLCSYICPSKIEVNESVKKAKILYQIEDKKRAALKGGK